MVTVRLFLSPADLQVPSSKRQKPLNICHWTKTAKSVNPGCLGPIHCVVRKVAQSISHWSLSTFVSSCLLLPPFIFSILTWPLCLLCSHELTWAHMTSHELTWLLLTTEWLLQPVFVLQSLSPNCPSSTADTCFPGSMVVSLVLRCTNPLTC